LRLRPVDQFKLLTTRIGVADQLSCIGIIVTSKKRQDLRIQLQKRARRRAEKKVEYLEDDKNWKEVSKIKPLGHFPTQQIRVVTKR